MLGPNAWQKHRDNLAGRIVAEALLRIEAGMGMNPQSMLQPINQEQTGAHLNPCRMRRPQSSMYAPLQIFTFEEKGLVISNLDTELEPLEAFTGFKPIGDPKLDIEPFKDSELRIELFEDLELNPDAKIGELPSVDTKHGIERTVGDKNVTSGQLDASVALNEWDIEPSDGELEGDDDDAEADMMMAIILINYLQETEDVCGPYGQIPTSNDSFAVSMMWKGDMTDPAWIYALPPLKPVPSNDLPKRIDHWISLTTFEFGEDDNDFFLESSSRAELEKAAHRFKIGPPHLAELPVQKPHPTAHSVPYIPTPAPPFHTISIHSRLVRLALRDSEHIRRCVVQAGTLGGMSCILAVLKGKRPVCRWIRSSSRPLNDNTPSILPTPSSTPPRWTTSGLEPLPTPSPVTTAILPPALAITRLNPNPSSESADEEMSGASSQQVVQPMARPAWSDANEAPAHEVTTTGQRGTITRRPRREGDTDGDDTEADVDNQTAQQGERRNIGIVGAADGGGTMATDMMGGGVGIGVVAIEQNDDFAMGAPPSAPGAIGTPRARPTPGTELTPRAGIAPLGTGQAEQSALESRRSVPVNPGPQALYETPTTLRVLVDASNKPKRSAPPLSATAQSPNVFPLVERFTLRPSPSETTPPRLPHEIQYWAGPSTVARSVRARHGSRATDSGAEDDSQTVVARSNVPTNSSATAVTTKARGGTQTRPANFQAGLARGAGVAATARGIRLLALPSRPMNTPADWTGPPRAGVTFFNEPAQIPDAGPSCRPQGPATTRRRSGTMPSQGRSNQPAETNVPCTRAIVTDLLTRVLHCAQYS
ncbi:Cell surface glycoprotein 1 [Rhizoctonia solani]|uniref:Cell surface glycoprotein 1 n=1 Tax=Rhizoctonia solani TaxID=456999 RepID=A0A0K6G8E7_9AGAM|nr:Cell surface glycoprotein 1 [Rhizoctonia solani]